MDVRLQGTFRLLSPLSHIGETIGNQTYLVQEPILQQDGSVEEVFVYSGNAWRGQLRDLAAAYMLDALGAPQLPLDAFHLLFAGGRIGGQQSTNIEQARQFRRAIPLVSMWGGGIGNQILPGKMRVRNCYPLVFEALPVLPARYHERAAGVSYGSVTFEKAFSRKDDSKDSRLEHHLLSANVGADGQVALLPGDDAAPAKGKRDDDVAQQMRMTVELVAPGTMLSTGIDVLDCSEIELGCLVSALHRFARSPHIGGQANRGHGLVELEYDIINLDTGEVQPFVTVRDGLPELAPPAAEAKRAYDEYVRSVYDGYLAESGSQVMGLLGARTA